MIFCRGRSGWEGVDDPQSTLVGEVTKILDNIQLLNNQLRKVNNINRIQTAIVD